MSKVEASLANSTLASWVTKSKVYRTSDIVTAARHTAAVTRIMRTLTTWIRASFLYRWLTAEPEPEIIVIDLRETYTVGPFIALIDRFITTLTPAYRESRLRRLNATLDRGAARLAETRTGQLLSAALAPPEPPDVPPADEHDEHDQPPTEDDGFRFPGS